MFVPHLLPKQTNYLYLCEPQIDKESQEYKLLHPTESRKRVQDLLVDQRFSAVDMNDDDDDESEMEGKVGG